MSLLVVIGATLGAWWSITSAEFLSFCHPARGANIITALKLGGFGSLGAILLIVVAKIGRWERVLLAALLLGAAVVGSSLALVLTAHATYRGTNCGSLFGGTESYVEHAHVGYLYVLWGVALGLLLVLVARVLRDVAS